MKSRTESRLFYGWIIAFASLAVTTTAFGILYSFGVFFKLWLREWESSRAFLSGVFSIAFLTYGISSYFMGNLTDRIGPRKTIALGGFIMGCGALLTAVCHTAGILYVSFGLMMGIGVGTSYSPTASTVSRWFVKKKGLAVGIVVSGLGLGTLVYSPLARLLVSLWGWRTSFLVFACMIWGIYFSAAIILRKSPDSVGLAPYGAEEAPQNQRESHRPVQAEMDTISALRSKSFWLLFFIHYLWVVGMVMPMVHLVPYATDQGVDPDAAAGMLAVIGGVSVLGRLVLGELGARFLLSKALGAMLFLQAISMVWLSLSTNSLMLWGFTLLFGFSYGGLASLFPLITAKYFGLLALGSIFGLILLGATLGGVIGPWLGGAVFDLTGSYSVGFLSGAGSMLLGVLLTFMLRQEGTAATLE